MEPISGLVIGLPAKGSRDLLRSLHGRLRAAIFDGRLRPGLKLPSTRALAAALGVSRNTTVAAYDLLLSEGYLTAKRGAGAFVADAPPRLLKRRAKDGETGGDRRLATPWRTRTTDSASGYGKAYRFDFRLGLPDKSLFPFDVWRRLSARALRALSKSPAAYAPATGRQALREAIAAHVSFARAVACDADDIVVTNGAQQAFDLLARILVTPGRTVVAIEEPGYPPLCAAFECAGARLAPIPVDAEGMRVDRLPANARVIVVTPSHQFPLGMTMTAGRRAALLEFAQTRRAAIIEDDYDGEFRLSGRATEALQTLDRGDCVLYVGTFSKSLFPALRLGFVVSPPWARAALIAAKHAADWHAPILAQDTLASFISEGHLARHVRRMRRLYGERRVVLRDALARHCDDWLTVMPADVGLHLAARITGPVKARDLAARAPLFDIGLNTLDQFALRRPPINGFAFNYGLVDAKEIEEPIKRLALLAVEASRSPRLPRRA